MKVANDYSFLNNQNISSNTFAGICLLLFNDFAKHNKIVHIKKGKRHYDCGKFSNWEGKQNFLSKDSCSDLY